MYVLVRPASRAPERTSAPGISDQDSVGMRRSNENEIAGETGRS